MPTRYHTAIHQTPRVLAALAIIVTTLACADAAAPKNQSVSISMATGVAAATASATQSLTAAPPIAGNGHTLGLTAIDLTIGDLRLERTGHQGAEEEEGVGADDMLFAGGSTTIALPVNGGVVTLSTRELPAGSFSKIEAELRSLHLVGSYDTAPFDVAVELSHDMKLALDPPLVTNGGAAENVTVTINFSSCFVNAAGTPVDPRTMVSGGSAARQTFRDCVASRLRAFEDRNRDGHEAGDDHGSDG